MPPKWYGLHKVNLLDRFPLIDQSNQFCPFIFVSDRGVGCCLISVLALSVFPLFYIALDQGVAATAGAASG